MDNNQEKINIDVNITSNSDKKIKEIESQITKLDVQAEKMKKKLEALQIPSVKNDSIKQMEKYNATLEKYKQILADTTNLHRELLKQKEISITGSYTNADFSKKSSPELRDTSRKENKAVNQNQPSVFNDRYTKLPDSIKNFSGSSANLNGLIEKFLGGTLYKTFNGLVLKSQEFGNTVTDTEKKKLAEVLMNEKYTASAVKEAYSAGEKKDSSVKIASYPTWVNKEDSGKLVYSSYTNSNGEAFPSTTAHIYGNVLKNSDEIGGIGSLNGKSLASISKGYDKLLDLGNNGDTEALSYAKAIKEYLDKVLRESFDNLEQGKATPAESKLIKQVSGSDYSTGDYYNNSRLVSSLRPSIQHIDPFYGELNGDMHDNPPEKSKYMGSELSSTEIKQEEAKVKTGMTGYLTESEKATKKMMEYYTDPKFGFLDSIKETAEIEKGSGLQKYIEEALSNIKDMLNPGTSLDKRETAVDFRGRSAGGSDVGSDGKYYGAYADDNAKAKDEQGREEAQKKTEAFLNEYNQTIVFFQKMIQELYDNAKTAKEKKSYESSLKMLNEKVNKIGNQYENGTNNPWTHNTIDGEPISRESKINVPANALSNYVTKGKVFRSSVKNYADKSGMDEQDALRQSIEVMEEEEVEKIKDSINARKEIDKIINNTTSKLKGEISGIGKTNDDEFNLVLNGLQNFSGSDILSNLSSYTQYANDYKTKIDQSGDNQDFEKQKKFISAFDEFVASIQSSLSSLKGNTDDKGLKKILASVESLFGDASNFIEFIQKFSTETYGVGQRSFNYNEEEAKKNKDSVNKEPVYSGTPKWEDRAPKERFVGQTQGLDYLAAYGATDLDSGITNAEARLKNKKNVLSTGDDSRQKAWNTINQIEQEREQAQAIIDSITAKYPTTTTKNRGTRVNWNLAKSGEWSDISTAEIAEDRNSYNKAKTVLNGTKNKNAYEDAQKTLREVGSYSDNIFKEIETIEDNLKFMRELSEQRKKAMEQALGTEAVPAVSMIPTENKKQIASPNLEDLADWSEKVDENTPIIPPTNGNPPSNNNYEGKGSFNIENADVKINNGNPITITQGDGITVNGNIGNQAKNNSVQDSQDFKDREFTFEEEARESDYEAKREVSRLGQGRLPNILKEIGVQEDVQPATKVNGVPVSTKISSNGYSDEVLKKIIDEKTPLVAEDKSGGQIFSAKDAVRNYLKADEEEIKLIGQRVALLAQEKQLREKIGQVQDGSAEKDKISTKLAENKNKLEVNQRQIEEKQRDKGITGVEEAYKNGNLGWANSTYEEQMKLRPSKVAQAINTGLDKGQENQTSSNASTVKKYISDYKELLNIQSKIQMGQKKSTELTGQQKQAQNAYVAALQKQETAIRANMSTYQKEDNEHINGTLNGVDLNTSEKNQLLNGIKDAEIEAETKTASANTQLKQQKGLLSQIAEGFKASFRNLVDYSIAYKIIGMINQAFKTLISTTKSLNSNMLNLRIVTGDSLEDTRKLLLEYNEIATQLGRTTASVADASNDWLRAGYQGKEAVELTKASLQLSTLGMIDASSATTDLISALKGWKLQASDVSGVVDRLTAVDMQAAISAGDLAEAMSRANNIARTSGSSMNKFIGYVTTVADVTQKSADSVGESFKTIYSRFQNVAAGKYTATEAERNSDDYNEDNYTALNDIEKVLDANGIKLRETATTYRNIDDVLSDIGTKWKNFDQVTQNALGTAIAGTRQRENAIALFDNWNQVIKYTKIAENSYGTATKKMEAYDDSLEASQNRVTAAIEKKALKINASGMLIEVNKILADIIDNIGTLTVAITALIAITNRSTLKDWFVKGNSAISNQMMSIGSFVNGVGKNVNNETGIDSIKKSLDESYKNQLSAKYNSEFATYAYNHNITAQPLADWSRVLSSSLEGDNKSAKITSEFLLGTTDSEAYKKAMIEQSKLLELKNIATEQGIAVEKQATTIKELETQVGSADSAAIKERISAVEKNTAQNVENTIALKNSNPEASKYVGNKIQAGTNSASGSQIAAQGALSLVGMFAGGAAGGQLTSKLGTVGEILGTTLGAAMGQQAMVQLGAAFSGAGLSAIGATGIVGIAIMVAGIFWKSLDAINAKKLKEAQDQFKKSSEAYQTAFAASNDISVYSNLSKGVDSLGQNVSLTDDEYKQFLDTSNELAKAFPELIVRTDDAGNSFVGMGGKVSDVTDKVKELTSAMQSQADRDLLNPTLLKDNLKTAQKEYSEAKKENDVNQGIIDRISTGKIENVSTDIEKKAREVLNPEDYSIDDSNGYNLVLNSQNAIDKLKGAYKELGGDYQQSMSQAIQSVSDESKAKVRQSFGDAFNDLSDNEVQTLYTAVSKIIPNTDNWEEQIEDVTKGMQEFLDKNPEDIKFYYSDNTAMSAEEYQKSRDKMYQDLRKIFPTMDENEIIQILFAFGYDEKGNDTNSVMQKIKTEGLDKGIELNGKSFESTFGKDFSVKEMTDAYELLKDNANGATYSVEQFKNAVYNKDYGTSNLTELVQKYKDFKNATTLTDSEKKQWSIVKTYLDGYAKELGTLPGQYDKIIEKAKIYGDLTYGGMSEKTPADIQTQLKDYGTLYDYLKNDYNGTWDEDKATLAANYSDLLPYIGNPKEMLTKLKSALDNGSNLYEDSIQNQLASNEEGSKAILDKESDKVKAFNKKYQVDLTNFKTLKEAENYLNAVSVANMTNDFNSWVTQMSVYYADDLTNFSDAASKKLAMSKLVAQNMGMDDKEYQGYRTQLAGEWIAAGKNGSEEDYIQQGLWKKQQQVNLDDMQTNFQDILNSYTSGVKFDSGTGSSKKSTGKSAAEQALDNAKAQLALIDKEWEAMRALDNGWDQGRATKYYNLEKAGLENEIKALKVAYNSETEQDKKLGYLKDIQDAEKAIKNLDDESLADKESWAETLGSSLDRMHQIYVAELKAADTYEEKINAQKKLEDLVKQEYEYRIKINEASITTLKRNQSYVNPLSKDYSNYTSQIQAQNQKNANEYLSEANYLLELYKKRRMGEVNSATGKKYTSDEAEKWAKDQSDYIEAINNYYTSLDNKVQASIDDVDAKVKVISNGIDTLNKSKPQEWTTISDIKNYTSKTIAGLNDEISKYSSLLNSGLELTYEQINDIVNKINDAEQQIQQAKIQQQEDIVSLRQKTYEAFTWQVNEYITAINNYKDIVDKAYDDEINKLKDINTSKERTIKLTQLLQNLENAQKEGKRVYREGVGWVYETDRSAVKKAQQEIDTYYSEDKITDLQNAKEKEDKILEERIKNWQDYLTSLEKAYNKYEDDQKKLLVQEALNLSSQEEIFNSLHEDMVENVGRLHDNLLGNNGYSGILNNFLSDLYVQLQTLDKYKKEWVETLKGFTLDLPTASTYTEDIAADSGLSKSELATIQSYRDQAKAGTITWDQANSYANQIRSAYGYTVDKSGNVSKTGTTTNSNSSGSSSSGSSSSGSSGLSSANKASQNSILAAYGNGTMTAKQANEALASIPGNTLKIKGYSKGIENGSVTYTGLAMLHGTPSNPEYVLNTSQMYNFVKNMSTQTPEYTNNLTGAESTNYNFYGNIDLPNVSDPSNFFAELMNATDNRINVTKNKV